MSRRDRKELRDLLFGDGMYPRRGAPEPDLLGVLAPLLPVQFLDEAVAVALQIPAPLIRVDALVALSTRLPSTMRGLLLAAWNATENVRSPFWRARVQMRILLNCPEDLRSRLRAATLATILRPEPDTGRQESLELLDVLAAELTTDQIARALGAILEMPNYADQEMGIQALLPYLDGDQVDTAFNAALTLNHRLARVLAPRLNEDRLVNLLNTAFAEEEDEYDLPSALPQLAPFLSPELLAEVADDATSNDEWVQTGIFVSLVPHADLELLDRLAPIAESYDHPVQGKEGVVAIARRRLELSPSPATIAQFLVATPWIHYSEAGRIVANIPDRQIPVLHELLVASSAGPRGYATRNAAVLLAATLPRLPQEQRRAGAIQMLDMVLAALGWEGVDERRGPWRGLDAFTGAWLVDAAMPYLAEDTAELLIAAAEGIRRISAAHESHLWLAAFICTISLIPAERRDAYAEEIAGQVRQELTSPSQRAAGLIEIARRLPEAARASYVGEVLALVNAVQDRRRRVGVLAHLLGALSQVEQHRIIGQVVGLTGPAPLPVRQIFADAVAARLNALPSHETNELLSAMIGQTRTQDVEPEAPETTRWDESEVVTPLAGPWRPQYVPKQTLFWMQKWIPAGAPVAESQVERGTVSEQALPLTDEVPPERVVNTGFAAVDQPTTALDPHRCVLPGSPYIFWLEVGSLVTGGIDADQVPLPGDLPEGAILDVVVFGYPNEIEITPGHDIGQLALDGGQSATVRIQPGTHQIGADLDVVIRRLLFPVRMPAHRGTARLRCSIYHAQVLLQSRVIEAHVDASARQHPGALRATVDYTLTHSLDPAALTGQTSYVASLMLNNNADGTHALRILATDGDQLLAENVIVPGGQLKAQIGMARAALRRVAWGSVDQWQQGMTCRYGTDQPRPDLAADLSRLAATGYRLHHLLLRALGRGSGGDAYQAADRIAAALKQSALVQIALKESAQHVLPAALLYDHPLDTGAANLTICPAFLDSLDNQAPLESTACFQGPCEHVRSNGGTVVCPSGFWGFRHALGLPVSIGRSPDASEEISLSGPLRAAVSIYRDFAQVDAHCAAVQALSPAADWCLTMDRESTLKELRTRQLELVYFYCHGGLTALSVPYLRVGRGTSGPVITADNLFDSRVRWTESRPLVFLNGCRTTELDPEQAIEFVSFFVEEAWARGVIGTEITVFEEFARPFAEECLRRFLIERQPIGEAVRGARLFLLHERNPLGLAYVPFVLPSVRLVG